MGPDGLAYQLNHRTSGLAVEARRRVAALRPTSGDAHFKLAEILWYTNPKVEDFWDLSDQTLIPIEPDDPSIREVLYELDQGWSYGLSENLRPDVERLVVVINRTVPGLDLMAPGSPTATVTLSPATETPVPTVTETSPPAASPTFTPEPVPSPAPAETTSSVTATYKGLLIVVLGILAAGGVVLYLWKSKL